MVLLRVFAVFWTAENMVEKKVAAWLPGETGPGPFSGVGVRGADVVLESLLGIIVPEPALALRWDIMFPDGDALVLLRGLAAARSG
jgi:hypothetical protein